MISINCTNCQALLEMDDAFAGGACRCQYCGTIQTVPSHLKGSGDAPAAPPQPSYRRTGRHGGTGLDELPDTVSGQGLSAADLQAGIYGGHAGTATAAPAPVDYARPQTRRKGNKTLLWVLIGVGALAILALAAWLAIPIGPAPIVKPGTSTRTVPGPVVVGGGGTEQSVTAGPVDDGADASVPQSPHFLGLDLRNASGVVYVLDRGSATAQNFDALKAATYRSVESLGSGKKFAILFWDTESSQGVGYPDAGLAEATTANVEAAALRFEDVVGWGRTDPVAALQRAAERKPSDVIFVTGKADDLPEELTATVEQLFKGTAHVHTVALVEDYGAVLQQMKDKTGGTYKVVSAPELGRFAKPD